MTTFYNGLAIPSMPSLLQKVVVQRRKRLRSPNAARR